jgi:hypothetical protein
MKLSNFKIIGITKLSLLLLLTVAMTACAGVPRAGSTMSWKEEVLLHDGSKVIVKRSFSLGGRTETSKRTAIGSQDLTFTIPATNKTVTWKSEFSEDVGRSNFNLLALHILNDTAYVVAETNGCQSYNKWGRPNPPYVLFKSNGNAWQRIAMVELPAEFKDTNVVIAIDSKDLSDEIDNHRVISAAKVKEINNRYNLMNTAQYRSIIREPLPNGNGCEVLVPYGNSGWLGLDWFSDQPSYEACTKTCERKNVNSNNCPCKTLFKEEK